MNTDTNSVINPHIKGIPKKFRFIWNCFNFRSILKTRYTLHGILINIPLVRDAPDKAVCIQYPM
jgi:hypothetical protein